MDRTRREFLRRLSLAAGAAAAWQVLGGRAGAAMRGGPWGAGAGFTGIVDPPPGAAFRDPAEASARAAGDGAVEVDLEAAWTPAQLNGSAVTLLTYNGLFPSPTIRVRRGQRLRVRFRNRLPQGPVYNAIGHDLTVTNLHTHGFHVSPEGNSDNVMVSVRPGEDFLYEYDLSLQEPGTLNYYHPHAHGSVAEQVWSGLGGALVVEDEGAALAGYETHLLVLKDLTLVGGQPQRYGGVHDFMRGMLGATVTVNGQVNPVLSLRPGQVQRWRVLNASTARFYELALEGHGLHLVGTDGGLLDRAYPVDRIALSPGERVDLLVQGAGATGRYRLLSLPSTPAMCGAGQQVTLLTVDCAGAPAADGLPAAVNPRASRVALDFAALPRRRLVLEMGMGVGAINGIPFGPQAACTVSSRLGSWEIWDVLNASCMEHCFHQHVNAAQVMAVFGGDPAYGRLYSTVPAWKDTVVVPAWGAATLLVPAHDFPGTSMFHCHILEHEDIGMMGNWVVS